MNLFRWHILTWIIILFYSCNGLDAKGKVHSADSASIGKMDTVTPEAEDRPTGGMQSHSIHLQKGIDLHLRLPAGYAISVACEELDRPRFLCKSPDHRLFVTDLFDISDNKEGKVYIFGDWDSVAKQYKTI